MRMKKLLALIAAAAMLPASGCGTVRYSGPVTSSVIPDIATINEVLFSNPFEDLARITSSDGMLSIDRSRRSKTEPMGEPGTWTIFVYLCGTDLESEGGFASKDLDEMIESTRGSQLRYVVETGGTKTWQKEIDSLSMGRYLIENGEMTLVDSCARQDMGKSETLTDFLRWGVQGYAAARMGLILWNHGSGSINGCCFDERSYDSLTLREIDASLYSVYDLMSDQFEFIGFDACLMGSVETAAILATHARYMIGSEELEPGCGWNYRDLGAYVAENPDATGETLGRLICDTFYSDCEEYGQDKLATLSVVDLSKTDEFLLAFHDYAKDMSDAAADAQMRSEISRAIRTAENFGGNNDREGYTNMVDLAALIKAGSAYSENADAVLAKLDELVLYKTSGRLHEEAGGISVYYPLQVQGSQEMSIFRDICISTYYLDFVDRMVYGLSSGGDLSAYSVTDFGLLNSWGIGEYEGDVGSFTYEEEDVDTWDYVDDIEITGESPAIMFSQEPHTDEGNNFCFTLSPEGLRNTESVQSAVFVLSDDEEDLICLGQSSDVYVDWSTGEVRDDFDGTWFSLPDGQNLCSYLISEEDGYDVYTSPILLNGEETYLRFYWDYKEGEVYILGTWDGMEDYGAAGRELNQLQPGDIIVPLYDAYALESDDEFYYKGDEYCFDGDPQIFFDDLTPGIYLYSFIINDIYGDYLLTDIVYYLVTEDGSIYLTDLE